MTLARALKFLILSAMVACLVGILASAARRLQAQNPPQKGEPQQQAKSVSNEDCAVCHEDLIKAFDKNPHVVLEKSPSFNLKNSCESCHGPGQAHVEGGGDKAKIISFKGDATKTHSRQCLTCHKKDHELTRYNASMHGKRGLACVDCHRVHAGVRMTRLLKVPSSPLCLSCHVEKRSDFAKPYHHRVKENAIACIDCHQPHGGNEIRQARRTSSGEVSCLHCHTDKSGPFVFEHAPLRIRDCQACHESHGSNNPKMLVRSTIRGLCLECHTMAKSGLSSQPPSFHDTRSPRYQNCTTCHARIHGSNSSRLFLR